MSARPMPSLQASESRVLVAVIVTRSGVAFSATAHSRGALFERLAPFVRASMEHQLWPVDAGRVRALLDIDELEAAVERYFALVGTRWDEHWLFITSVDADSRCGTRSDTCFIDDDRS